MEKFICPKCGNSNPRFIGHKKGLPYCRACISFTGKEANPSFSVNRQAKLELSYDLSLEQQKISTGVLNAFKAQKNILIHAVTGAGKTELVYKTMEYCLNQGLHVGFSTPRKDVVIDLLPRIQSAFKNAKVSAVYGGKTTILNADIIILTTHQLYRYNRYFDLLILDEIDAFPYSESEILHSFFKKSVRGNYILMSATATEKDMKEIEEDNGVVFSLYIRYHRNPLPVPQITIFNRYGLFFTCLKKLQKHLKMQRKVFVFVPTIAIGKILYSYLSIFIDKGAFVSAKEEKRRVEIEHFKNGELDYLVTTSILERGVTIRNLQVIVFFADHEIYDASTLVQIAGRVGRKSDCPKGDVDFLITEENDEVNKAVDEIKKYNRSL